MTIRSAKFLFCDNEHGTGNITFPDILARPEDLEQHFIRAPTAAELRKEAKQAGMESAQWRGLLRRLHGEWNLIRRRPSPVPLKGEMMFRTEAQQCQAIRILLKSLNLDHLWTAKGPTNRACDWLESSPLSSGEQVLLRCAFDFWNGAGNVTLDRDLLGVLDSDRLLKVLTLAMAANSGGAAVDRWIAQEGPLEDIAS